MASLPRPTDPRCADVARQHADSWVGTAGPAVAWVLVEHPGPWPAEIRRLTEFAGPAGERLFTAAHRHGARVLAVRRFRERGEQPVDQPRRLAVASQRHGTTWWTTWSDHRDLLRAAELVTALDQCGPGAGPAPADREAGPTGEVRTAVGTWDRDDRQSVLVCTHAQHDPCCARYGREVASHLHRRFPGVTWQCSHLGGDRFAGNVLLAPAGTMFGGLDRDSVQALGTLDELARGRPLDHLRGVCGLSPAAQASLVAVLRERPEVSWPDLALLAEQRLSANERLLTWQVPYPEQAAGQTPAGQAAALIGTAGRGGAAGGPAEHTSTPDGTATPGKARVPDDGCADRPGDFVDEVTVRVTSVARPARMLTCHALRTAPPITHVADLLRQAPGAGPSGSSA
ncbi:MAG: sucrase ferredoxin [Actinomycetales bacterium]